MDKNKIAALASAIAQVELLERSKCSSGKRLINVKVSGESDLPPNGLQEELDALFGRSVSIVWQKITKRDIPRTNSGEITYGVSAEQRYYEDAARRGARTGD